MIRKRIAAMVGSRTELLPVYERFPFFIRDSSVENVIDMHAHDFFEIDMVLGGSGTNAVRGNKHALSAGDIVIGNQFEGHELCPSPSLSVRSIKFGRSIIGDDVDARLILPFISRLSAFRAKITLADDERETVFNVSAALLREYEGQKMHWERTVASLFSAVLTMLYRSYETYASRRGIRVSETAQPLVTSILAYLDANYTADLRIAALLKQFSISASHANMVFKRATGRSIKDYLTVKRLARARKLLAETETPVSDICFAAGFSDISNFNRAFKAFTGKAPGEFRKDPR